MQEEVAAILVLITIWIGFCGGIGMWIADQKGRSGAEGFVLGSLLGAIGWIIIALLPTQRRQAIHRSQDQTRVKSNELGLPVSRADFGSEWPLLVERGYVDSIDGAAIFVHGSDVYALNAAAKQMGYTDISPIWRNDPARPGTKVGLGLLIDIALDIE